jgi:ribosomal protein L22
MAEKESKKIEKAEKEIAKDVAKIEKKVEDRKITQTEANKEIEKDVQEKAAEVKDDDKEESKPKKQEAPKKDLAVANAYSLKISPKQSKYVCRMIRGKSPEAAASRLREVIDEKRAVPMAGLEVAHKHGMAGGKFPKNACKAILEVVKQLSANANMLGIEQPIITIAKADRGSAPYRRAGQKGKRTHLHLEVRDKSKLVKKNKK